ncbi:hypothetical protein Vadar_024839 [Vaccinium darrowii]|uniref:Uncharacterized protein n=1 Tax=Vaccinium darrowii TaxID=229202 RepID=A0ACB7Z8K3_9ERIC|nr:hypothetical protein Vadar_024839 [Vaccinium darrowii]
MHTWPNRKIKARKRTATATETEKTGVRCGKWVLQSTKSRVCRGYMINMQYKDTNKQQKTIHIMIAGLYLRGSIQARDRKLAIVSESIDVHLLLSDTIEKETLFVKQVLDNVQHLGEKLILGSQPMCTLYESTLNQLLVKMDGFGTVSGGVVFVGTNKPDILYKALLKPGADIANVCNEAALIATRNEGIQVKMDHFKAAIDRVICGLKKKNKVISKLQREIVAYHELGHAVAGWFLEHAEPLLKVTIVHCGTAALGFAKHVPNENLLMTKEQLFDMICMTLGAQAATGQHSTPSTLARVALKQKRKLASSPTSSQNSCTPSIPNPMEEDYDDLWKWPENHTREFVLAMLEEQKRSLGSNSVKKVLFKESNWNRIVDDAAKWTGTRRYTK